MATPQDHKSKNFSFEHDGKTYVFEKPLAKVKTFGWQRKNRHLSDEEKVFAIFEEVAGDEALAALDEMEMDGDEFKALMENISEEMGANLGE